MKTNNIKETFDAKKERRWGKLLPPHSSLLTLVLLLVMASCGGGSGVEKAVRQALIDKDTTAACFDSICSLIMSQPKRNANLLTADGAAVDVQRLQALVDEVGGKLRPPMQWDLSRYGNPGATLTVYFERSGSMVPYDTKGGGGQLKKVVNDLINAMPDAKDVSINIVNDGIYPYRGSVAQFLQDRDIYASTANMGDAAYTDFGKIFTAILEAQRPGNISVLVTDLIYSPADTRDVSVAKIFNEENSLATQVFKRYKGKSVIVAQYLGDYHGKYYPYNNAAFEYNGKRPFYVIFIADTKTLDAAMSDPARANLLSLRGARNSYRFNHSSEDVPAAIIPDWKDNAGRFRIGHGSEIELTHCEGDRETGVLSFSIAVDFSRLHKNDQFLCDAANYNVQSLSGFTLAVQALTPDMVTANNKSYLEGKTHVLTLTAPFKGPRDDIQIRLPDSAPKWIAKSSANDDRSASVAGFSTSTLGLEHFLNGIRDAFAGSGESDYFQLSIKLKN